MGSEHRKGDRSIAVVFYVSAHGYGHATRQSALLAQLRARRPDLSLIARTQAPGWLLFPEGGGRRSLAAVDPGLSQLDGFRIELEKSLRRHERFAASWDALVTREARFLERTRARLVVGDVPALGFAAAAKAGLAARAVANFSWDWALEPYAREQPRWRPIVDLYAGAYRLCPRLFKLPMSAPMPAFPSSEPAPLLARRCVLSREQARAALGLPRTAKPLVLASFGGLGRGPLDLSGGDDLSDYGFIGFGAPPRGLKAAWRRLPEGRPWAHVEAMAACDAVAAKPGYGVLSEALAHGRRALLLPREGFAEIPPLVSGFLALGSGERVSGEDFARGRWRRALERLLGAPEPAPIAADGAAFVAQRLLALL